MGIVVVVLLGLVVALFGAEVQLARRGEQLDEPDVATLTTVVGRAGAPERHVLWLGDSTAAAVGTSAARFAVSTAVADRVTTTDDIAVDSRVIAKSGALIGDVLDDQVQRVRRIGPDVVVISVGANDTVHLTSVNAFRSRYRKLLAALRHAGLAAERIVLVGVPDMGAPPRLRQPLRAVAGLRGRRLDREVKRLARETGARYVDLFAATSSEFRAHPGRYFAADRYHPSDAGYALWADVIAPAVVAASRTIAS